MKKKRNISLKRPLNHPAHRDAIVKSLEAMELVLADFFDPQATANHDAVPSFSAAVAEPYAEAAKAFVDNFDLWVPHLAEQFWALTNKDPHVLSARKRPDASAFTGNNLKSAMIPAIDHAVENLKGCQTHALPFAGGHLSQFELALLGLSGKSPSLPRSGEPNPLATADDASLLQELHNRTVLVDVADHPGMIPTIFPPGWTIAQTAAAIDASLLLGAAFVLCTVPHMQDPATREFLTFLVGILANNIKSASERYVIQVATVDRPAYARKARNAKAAESHDEILAECKALLDTRPKLCDQQTRVAGVLAKQFKDRGRTTGYGKSTIHAVIAPLFAR